MAQSERGEVRRGERAAAWRLLLISVVCCAGLAFLALAGGAGLAGVGIARASTWLLIAGVLVIAIALSPWRIRAARHRRNHA